jgi:hypothetical protein
MPKITYSTTQQGFARSICTQLSPADAGLPGVKILGRVAALDDLVVSSENPDAFADAVITLAGDTAQRNVMSAQAKRIAPVRMSAAAAIDKLRAIAAARHTASPP